MTLSIIVTGTTGIDESGGNQQQDVDAFPSGIDSIFNAAFANNSFPETFITDAIQLSGVPDDGDAEGNDVTVISDDHVSGLSLTDSGGVPFDGTDSGLLTLAGDPIYLFTDSINDNVVLGIDSNTGDLVFAIYLEEVRDATTSEIIGGDFWMALFEPISHPDGDDVNDVVDLAGVLYVSGESEINFSFTGAPSGQNEFMAFGESGGVAIIATGLTVDDTVNSGQGGNNPNDPDDKTALGTNSQDIGSGETLVFTFVTDMDPNYLVPDLTSTEAGDDANIQFGDVFGSSGAAFNVVKVTGGPSSTTPDVTISAWNTENLSSGDLEEGAGFIVGQGDDQRVSILTVSINGLDVTDNTDLVRDNGDGTFTIIGAVENDRISYTTSGDHNRLYIENSENAQVAFSVAGFSLNSTSGAIAEAGSFLDFYDDGPSEGAQAVELAVWEDALTAPNQGNPDDDGATETTIVTDDISGIFNPGTDAPGLHFGVIGSKDGTTLTTLGGVAILLEVNKDINAAGTDQVFGSVGGVNVFELLVDPDGSIRFELLSGIDHNPLLGGNPDDDVDSINLGDLFEAFDEDGDRVTFSATAVKALIEDDAPVFDMADGLGTLQTDDGALFGGNAGGTAVDTLGVGSLFSVTTSLPGADGDGGVVYNLELGADTTTSVVDTLTGNTVFLFDESGDIVGREGIDVADAASGDIVFTLTVNATTGAVTQTQSRAVQHSTTDTEAAYDVDVINGIDADVLLRGTLSDGETVADTATDFTNIADNISFTDDGPVVNVDDTSGYYDVGAQGDWFGSAGADGFQSFDVTLVGYEIGTGGETPVDAALTKVEGTDYSFDGTIVDDFNGDGVDDTVEFTLIFDPDTETYDLQVTTPPSVSIDISTADGSLDAGGPDPVRTLTVGTNEIVFSAVDPTTVPEDITSILNEHEAYIETTAVFLSDDEMNVSQAGIGNGNNNFDGNAISGIDGETTNGGKVDESFVVDPTDFDVSSVKVYIDNSVGGYDNPPEELYYNVYYSDGTPTSTDNLVVSLTDEDGGQVSFVIGSSEGPNNIDAVQLFMGRGAIKIPVIEFTTTEVFDPEALSLNFSGTLLDGDDDSYTDTFMIDLDLYSETA
jgi:hypothetical protein